MGQQQLLLVILVTIIVGIASAVAITTFSSASDSSNVDAVRQDMLSIGSTSQGYLRRPAAFGGGGNDFTNMTFVDIAFASDSLSSDGMTAYNKNGTYALEFLSTTSICLTATPASSTDGNELHVDIYQSDMEWFDNE